LIHPETVEDYGACASALRVAAETKALAELETAAGVPAPQMFRDIFLGLQGTGWHDAYALYVTEALKTDERFRSIFMATKVVDIDRAVQVLDARMAEMLKVSPQLEAFRRDVAGRLGRIERKVDAVKEDTSALIAGQAAQDARFNRMEKLLAAEKGVPIAVVRPIFDHLGLTDLTDAEVLQKAGEAIDALLAKAREVVTPSNDGADIDAVIGASRKALGSQGAQAAVTLLQAKIDEEEHARRQRLIPLLTEQADIKRLSYDHGGALATLQKLVGIDPDQIWAWGAIGEIFLVTGDTAKALSAFQSAADAARRTNSERDLAVSFERIAVVQQAIGNLTAALRAYREGLAIHQGRAVHNDSNAQLQRDILVSLNGIGNVQLAMGNLNLALTVYYDVLAIAEAQASNDDPDMEWQHVLLVSLSKIGNVQQTMGNSTAALKNYQSGIAIARVLLERSPI
jgi:tetratricopeptide (TPR) repeat protein